MLDLSIYKKQYYPLKIKEGFILNLESPKRKQLKKMMSLTKTMNNENLTEEDIDALYEAVFIALNKNKEGKKISMDLVDEVFNFSSIYAFFNGYYTWVAENINAKN